jgi:phosphoribosyl-ATP pyrophosphohydrolase
MSKLVEEKAEVNLAWSRGDDHGVSDELADCLICVLAAMAREGIDPEHALSIKFAKVRLKYPEPQPDPADQLRLAL